MEEKGNAPGERLQKVLSAAGVASRRAAEAMIARGEVLVNGQVAHVGQRARVGIDRITVGGRPLQAPVARTYLALNKPAGIVTSLASTHGERTVVDLLPVGQRVFPVGRLDKDTSGLLLLTDDGEWGAKITHPRYEVEKEYQAVVRGVPSPEAVHALRHGIVLPGGVRTAPARVSVHARMGGECEVSVTVIEGKKRQLRLMFAAVGYPVTRLRRVRIGAIRLGTLREGSWRALTAAEIESVEAWHGSDE
jgi:23S rRNA pseudouridine2605 synthase